MSFAFSYSKIAKVQFSNENDTFTLKVGDRVSTPEISGVIIEIRKNGKGVWGNSRYFFHIFVEGPSPKSSLTLHTGDYHYINSDDLITT